MNTCVVSGSWKSARLAELVHDNTRVVIEVFPFCEVSRLEEIISRMAKNRMRNLLNITVRVFNVAQKERFMADRGKAVQRDGAKYKHRQKKTKPRI